MRSGAFVQPLAAWSRFASGWGLRVYTGRHARFRFTFSSTTAGAKFECSVGKRVKPKGKKARFVGQAFKGCKSPKSYTLQPGRYRFQVRSVSGSLRDSSPAQYNFKVIHVAHK